ncbi:MAG TPA: rhodanese-like domain-containing protein [Desulfatiglandales bacterium]|nr:rhodanese-like domain-containing protein [Desulfatiglandales bacterium]
MKEGDMLETNNRSVLKMLLAHLGIGLLLASICLHFEGGIARPESQTQITKNITPKEAYTLILKNKDNHSFVTLDVRTPREFANGHIEDAVNLDCYSETFKDTLNRLDHNKIYLIYCQIGGRSGRVLDLMKELGFREVYNISGGIIEWKEAGLPITE